MCSPGAYRDHGLCDCRGARMEGLLQPCLLLLLYERSTHGYELIEKMNCLGLWDGVPDAGAVYRHLRRLEEEGLVRSQWLTDGPGPARRRYEITPEGIEYLHQRAATIRRKKTALEAFLRRYDAIFGREDKGPSGEG